MKVHFKYLSWIAIVFFLPALISAQTINWLGGNGNWSDGTKWDNGVPVGNDNIVIDNSAANSAVNMNISATVGSLTVNQGDQLSVANAQNLTINGGPVNNNGTITLAHTSTSGVTDLQVIGNVNFNGSGTLKLGNGGSTVDDRNRIFGSTNAQRLTNGADHTIIGSGQIGVNQMRLTNQGTIIANDTNNIMTIDLAGGDNFNTGTIESVSNSTMNITGSSINNDGGLVHTNNGAINLNSSTISDGLLRVSGGSGRLTLNSSVINSGATLDINSGNLNVNSSTIQDSTTNVANGATMTLNASNVNNGMINNNGNVTVSGSSVLRNGNLNNSSQFTVNNAQTLTLENGNFNNDGTILLNHTSTSGVTDLQVTGVVTLGGTGELKLGVQSRTVDDRNRILGTTNAQRLVNDTNHTISGSGQIGVNQMRLTNRGTITANDTNNIMTIDLTGGDNFNTGTIESASNSTMNIVGSAINNNTGLVRANNGNINVNSSTISNGTLQVLNNNGNITLNSSNVDSNATLNVDDGNLNVNSSTIESSTTNVAAGATMTLNASNVNNGMINNSGNVTVSGSSVLRNGNLNNSGQFTVNNAQTLTLENGNFNNDGTILLNHTSSTGVTDLQVIGVVTLGGNGQLKLGVPSRTIDDRNRIFGSTNAQRLVNDTNHTIIGSGQIGVNQMRLTNRGTITANDTNNIMTIDLAGGDNFNTGTIESVSNSTMNIVGSTINNNGGLIRSNNGDININSSSIGNGNLQVLGNSGRITLNSTNINSNATIGVTNGNLNVNSSTIQDSTTNVSNGATMTLNASNVDNGMINNSGNVTVSGSSVLRNGNLNNSNQFTVNNAQTLTLEGGTFTNNGTMLLNHTSTSGTTDLQIVGVVTLSGNGELKLGVQSRTVDDRNRIFGSTNAQRLINDTAHTISGSGQIGVNQIRLTNFGRITANDTNNVMTIDLSGADNFNQGRIEAIDGSQLNITGTSLNNECGLIHANNGIVNINSSDLTEGNYQVDGTSGRMILNSSNINGPSKMVVSNGRLEANSSTINGSIVEVGSQGRFVVNSSIVNGTNNGGKIKNNGLVEVIGASSFQNSSLKNDGQVIVRNASTLTLQDGVFQNNGTLQLQHTSTSGVTDLQIIGTVNLTGTGKLQLGSNTTTVDDRTRIFGSTNAQRLIQGSRHTIEGGGQLGVNQIRLTNRGVITGNDANNRMTIDLAGGDNFNSGTIRSVTNGSVLITGTSMVNSEGSAKGTIAANGGSMTIASSSITGGGQLIATQGGLLSITSSNITVDSIAMDNSRISIASSNVSLSEGFAYATTNANNWNLNTASVSLTGGQGAAISDWDNWSYIEVGGRDLNNDGDGVPSITQLIGTSAGFNNNFDMQQLTIGNNSKVFLMNMFDNQAGVEALYVDTFILSAGSTLYLNGINLYFSNFINQGGTIITDNLGVASLSNFSIPGLVLNTTIDPQLPSDPDVKPLATQIPEPATWLSMLIALCCITFVRSRRQAKI